MATYPATTYAEGVDLTITSGNQLHEIINGTATSEVTTESGLVPSVRKAIADSMLFKPAIAWADGSVETDPFQTRTYSGQLFWAPEATSATPIAMGTSPLTDNNWFLAPVGLSKSSILSTIGKINKGFWDDDPKLENENDFVVERNTGNVFGAITFPYQVDSATNPDPNALVPSELNDVSDFTTESQCEKIVNTAIDNRFPDYITSIVQITEDTTIENSRILDIRHGGGFNVASGVTLTINSQVNAGHYQIFFGDGLVQTDYMTNFLPKEKRHRINKVKAAWFGVINDAEFPSNYGNGNAAVSLGMTPKGTDNASAIKKAVRFCQWGSMHGGAFMNLAQTLPLEFEQNATIFASGDNLFGEQIFTSQLSAIRAEAQVSGGNFKSLPEYQEVAYANFNFEIKGNGCTLLWQPILESNVMWQARQLITSNTVKDFNVAPVGFVDNETGIMFRNEALEQKDNPSVGFFNNLSFQTWDNCDIGSGKLDSPLSSMPRDTGIAQHFVYLGYSLGDRLHLNQCRFDNINRFIYCQNPEAVEFKAEDCEFRSFIDNAVFFDYVSFFGAFSLVRGGIFMKGQDQTLIRTRNLAGVSRFTDSAQFNVVESRMEGADGLRKVLVEAAWGRFYLRGFTESAGMTSPVTGSKAAILTGSATFSAKDCTLPRVFNISNINLDDVDSRPIVELTRCKLNGANGIEKFNINGKNYKYAIIAGDRVPRVDLGSLVPTSTGNILPNPTYGDGNVSSGAFISCNVKERDNSGFERINGITVTTPLYIAVKSIFIRTSSMTSDYKKVRAKVGSLELKGDIDPSGTRVELVPENQLLVINFDTLADSVIEFDFLDAGDNVKTGGGTGYAQIEYRSIQGKLETPNGGTGGAYLV